MNIEDSNSFKEIVKNISHEIYSLESQFIQYKQLSFMSQPIISEGNLKYKAPNRILWKYQKPIDYKVLFVENKLFINDEGKSQKIDLSGNKMFESFNELIIKSITGNLFDDKNISYTFYKLDKKKVQIKFDLKDPKLSKFIETFYITFNAVGHVLEVKLMEHDSDYTLIKLNQRKINTPLPDEDFRF